MKPTIASQSKANGALRNSNSNLRRRGMQSSSGKRNLIDGFHSLLAGWLVLDVIKPNGIFPGNLFMANQDDSSSEETAAAAALANVTASSGVSPFTKPVVPPRPRSILSSTDHKKHNNLNNVMNAKNSSSSSSSIRVGGEQYAVDLMPSKEADLSNEKCEEKFLSLKNC